MQPILETPRLLIRELLPTDAEGMFIMDSNPNVHRYIHNKPLSAIEDVRNVIEYVRSQYVANNIGRWAMIEKTTDTFVGWTGFKLMNGQVNGLTNFYDFGYRLREDYWGKGLATEGATAALAYGTTTLNIQDVYAMTDVDNAASRRVLEKIGFRFINIFNYDSTPDWRFPLQPTTWYHYQQRQMGK